MAMSTKDKDSMLNIKESKAFRPEHWSLKSHKDIGCTECESKKVNASRKTGMGTVYVCPKCLAELFLPVGGDKLVFIKYRNRSKVAVRKI